MDPIFKATSLQKEVKTGDAELARVQALMHDPVAPLIRLLHACDDVDTLISINEAKEAVVESIQLLGNASVGLSRLRRKRLLKSVNPDIADLAEEEIFEEAAPNLFGSGFEKKMKERAESIKLHSASKSSRPTSSSRHQFFQRGRPTAPPKRWRPSEQGEVLAEDQWLLDTIQGYKIEFVDNPTQAKQPRVGMSSPTEQALLQEEVGKMLSKRAIVEIPAETAAPRFYSSLFLVPKKDGGMRPVINLKELNTYVAPHHFKMEGLHTLKDLLKTGDWMTKVDRHYQYTCLPFGLSCAPWVFTKTLKPVLTLLRELGVRLVAYIDDVLVLAEMVERARDHTNGLTYLLGS